MKRPDSTDERSPALDWVVSHGAVDQVFDEVAAQLQRRRRRRLTVATAAVAVALAGIIAWKIQGPPRAAPATVATAPALGLAPTSTKQTLSDGSVVELKDDARIAVNFGAGFRRVSLLRGRAEFQVAKDPAHPFVVNASGVEVRAIGTVFTVDLGTQAVEVRVTEGRVAVEQPAAATAATLPPPAVPTFVDAGNHIIVDLVSPPTPSAPAVNAPTVMSSAPRAPRIVLSGTSLGSALPIFNQHARVKLSLGDPALASVQLSGVLRADNTDALLQLLKDQFGIVGEPRGDMIVLHK